jgi:hypothetical protein
MSGELRVSLHPGQSAIYNSPARFKVVAAGRRFGKSHFAACMLGIEALRQENDRGYRLTAEHGVYYIAPTADQARRVMWPKLREILGYKEQGGFIIRENVNDGWLELVSGRRIYIKGADNPDSLRGVGLSFVVLDEYADMKANVWSEIIRPALMDVEGSALFIGTPKGKNHFFKLFMNALEKPEPTMSVEGLDDADGENPWAEWEAFHFKSTDNPFLSRKELRSVISDNDNRDTVRQELEASFISGSGNHLKPEWFNIVETLPEESIGQWAITVDLAGYSDKKNARRDETVIAATLVTPDGWFVDNMEHGQWDVREVALRIVRTMTRYHGAILGIEKGALMQAVGPYLEDYMREFGRYFTPNALSHGNTKKLDRIIWALQGRAQRGMINLRKGPWNDWFLDQCADLGDPLSHDDGPDTLAYVDQMVSTSYVDPEDFESDWQPLDLDSGY